jgi:hypothetical protein
MSNVKQINNAADRLEIIVAEMEELLGEAGDLIRTIDTLGEAVGVDLNNEFDNYICPALHIRFGEGGAGYMTNDKGLLDLVAKAREAATELSVIEANESEEV